VPLRRLLLCFALLIAACAAIAGGATAGSVPVRLGEEVRVRTPGVGVTGCPLEGEPSTAVTSAGTWVAYNDDQTCPINPTGHFHLTTVQLLPEGGGQARLVTSSPLVEGEYFSGDPALAPDPAHPGSVLLATLLGEPNGSLIVGAFRIAPSLVMTRLPKVTITGTVTDDKEFLASDTGRASRYRGRSYLVWDAIGKGTVLRSFDGRSWGPPVVLQSASGFPDVAVGPDGTVAAVYETGSGVAVRVSHDGGRTFSPEHVVLLGTDPGRSDAGCPLRGTIGQHQRASKSVRVAFDIGGGLHVVAALGSPTVPNVYLPTPGAVTGGSGQIEHAVSYDGGRTFATGPVAPAGSGPVGAPVQWAPAVAALPTGGVAIAWLETTDLAQTSYDSHLAVLRQGAGSGASTVIRLSRSTSDFLDATEAFGNSNCYGIGDYIGLAPTSRGVTATWPTTAGTTPGVDSDVLVRSAYVR
jgi:hypothetical protein